MTTLKDSVALVTGANRGIGAAFVDELVARGASKVYAAARNPEQVRHVSRSVVPIEMDVTDPASVQRASREAGDVSILINNAGISRNASVLDPDQSDLHDEIEVNLFGPLRVATAFVDGIEAAGDGVILNFHSVLSWYARGNSYSVSKAAIWHATNSMRIELAPRGIHVMGLHVGFVDTELAAVATGPKMKPSAVAVAALDGVERDDYEVLADDWSREVKAGLSTSIEAQYPQLADLRVPRE